MYKTYRPTVACDVDDLLYVGGLRSLSPAATVHLHLWWQTGRCNGVENGNLGLVGLRTSLRRKSGVAMPRCGRKRGRVVCIPATALVLRSKRRGLACAGGRPESLAGAQNVGQPFPTAIRGLGLHSTCGRRTLQAGVYTSFVSSSSAAPCREQFVREFRDIPRMNGLVNATWHWQGEWAAGPARAFRVGEAKDRAWISPSLTVLLSCLDRRAMTEAKDQLELRIA